MKNVKIVIGANFGDEGKGLMSAYFAEEMMRRSGKCLTILSNGGAQRGHTVVRDVRHVFRHFGSGTFAGADTYFPAEFIVNPMIFMKEYRELTDMAPGVRGPKTPGVRDPETPGKIRIFIHPDCMVTTPFEMLANLILEESRGKNRHGSVGVGIWETVISRGKRYGELIGMSEEEQLHYLICDRKTHLHERLLAEDVQTVPASWRDIIEDPGLVNRYLHDLREMHALVRFAGDDLLDDYPELVFENGQGLLLDRSMLRKGYGHHTTPSHTGIRNPMCILENAFGKKDIPLNIEAVYVTRSYMTRHGAGRFDTECPKEAINPEIRDLTNQPNDSQGAIRYGTLNMQSLVRRVKRDFGIWQKESSLWKKGSFAQADWCIAMTHLNEYRHPSAGGVHVKYKSFSETGRGCVILRKK